MRLWSFHPRYLDRQGLTACWRESLLAQAVIVDASRGYSRHPQLERFREQADPLAAVGAYLCGVAQEATRRGYRFDRSKIRRRVELEAAIPVATGQLHYEWSLIMARLQNRSPEVWALWTDTASPEPHPLFQVVPGPVATWERVPKRDGQ